MATPPRVFMLSGGGSELGIIRSQLRLQFRSTPISPNFLGQHRKITSLQYYFSCIGQSKSVVVHQLSKRRSQVIGFELTGHVFTLGGVAFCEKVLRAGLVYRSDVFKSHSYTAWILFVPIEIPPDTMLHEKSIYFMSAFFRAVVCLQYFLLMTLSGNSKYSFLYFSPVPFQESQRPRSTRAVSPNQTISVCSCK